MLLDVDGTLIDSNYLHALAWARSFAEGGVTGIPTAEIHRHIGMGSSEMLQALLGEDRDDLDDAHTRHYAAMRDDLRRLPGARELLLTLQRRGLRVVLATSAKPDEVDALRRTLDADSAISHVVSSQDVPHAKPAPDLFAVAHERSGVPAGRSVAVGDTVWDVRAASGAGIPRVCVTTGGISPAELRDAGAAAVYRDCAELLDRLDDSPIGALLAG